MNNKVLKKIIGLTDKVKTMADKKTIIKLKTLKESANRDFTEADLAQREIGFNEKDNILYFRRSDGTIVKVETPTPEQLQLQYNGSEIAQYDGNINTTANFIINSENIPLSETDSTTVSEELEKKLEADVLELYVSLESYNKFNDIMFGSIDWEQSYENGFIPQLIVNVEQSFFDDLGNPENIDGKPYNPTSNNYKIGSTYLCIGGFDSTLTFKYDLWTAGNLPNESGYIINSIASAMSLLDDKFPNYYTKSEADSKLAEKLDISVASTTYATKEELNNKVSSVYKYKGSVATEEELPQEGNVIGDVYNVESDGSNYAWDGEKWDKLGGDVDLSLYLTKEEASSTYATKTEIPTELPNPETLTVTVNNEAFVTYDGSTAVTQDLVMNAETIPLNADTTLTVAYGLEQVTPLVAQIPIRTLQDKVYDQETILGWFGQESVADIKQKIVRNAPVFVKYGIQLSGNPHYYKFPVEYCAFESANQIKMVFQGLNTKDDVVSKYEIIINLDGTVIEGNSNVKVSITSLENKSYNDLTDKPSINNVELSGNKTLENLGIQPAGEYLVASDIANKADKATTLSGYGITDAYTKSEVDSKLSTVYKYKGSVATYEELPSAYNEVGDVYNVETDGMNYAWDGTTWDKLGGTVDLSNYYTKSQVDTELGKKLDITTASSTYATITTVNGKADKATTLSGYGITDAYTTSEVDSKLDTKQNTLSTEQLDAVNSGITAEHITSYDAYAGEISAAQTTADKADNAAEVAQQTANLVGTNLQTVTEKIPTSASSSNLLVDTASMNESLLSKLSFKQITVPANNWYIYAEAPKDEVTTFYVDGADYFNVKIPEMIVIGLSSRKVSSVSTMAYDDSNTSLNSSYGSKQYYETDDKIRIAIKSSSEIQVNVYFDPNSNLTVLDTPVLPTSEDGGAKSVNSATLPSLSYLTTHFMQNDDYKSSLSSMYNFSFGVFTNNEQMPSDNRTLVLSLGDGIYDDTGANSPTNYFGLLAIDKTTKKLYLFVGDETNLTRQSWKEITTLEELNALQSEINTSLGNKADKATTLSGYGITDAYTSEEVDNKLSGKLDTTTATSTYATITTVNGIEEVIPEDASATNQLVDTNAMNTALASKANTADLGTMSAKNASDYSTKAVADTLYAPIRKSVTDTDSTTITLANADANTVYHYGTLDSLTITAVDISDLETIIWFTPSANLTNIVIPDTIKPMNEFKPVSGKLCCVSILNGTVVYGSIL